MARPSTNERKRRRRAYLFKKQGGRCFWCKGEMVNNDYTPHRGITPPPNLCTLEHLDDRFSEKRGAFNGKCVERTVAACWLCNWKRGRKREARQQREELWRRSGRSPPAPPPFPPQRSGRG